MATRTQVHPEQTPECIHELICQAELQRQQQRIHTLCHWMVPHHGQARELAAKIFLEAWRIPAQTPPAVAGDPLIRGLAHQFRHLFAGGEAEWTPGPQAVEPNHPLRAAVQALPPAYRLLYLLHDIEGVSAASLGVWLNLAPTSCARMIHRARVSLRATAA